VMLTILASSGFFVALAFGLLLRYKQLSQKIVTSTDLGKDLWQALDQRLRKQDERILDMMGRFEVIQSRVTERLTQSVPMPAHVSSVSEQKQAPTEVSTHKVWSQGELDPKSVLTLLSDRPRSTTEIKEVVGKSREHTARLMKSLFDRGLVLRDDSKKPFVYKLSETGRRYLSVS